MVEIILKKVSAVRDDSSKGKTNTLRGIFLTFALCSNDSEMNKKSLKKFLFDANQAGYARGEERNWIKEDDGSTTIPFEKGSWMLHDNFFGGEPYGGRTVVYYQERPVWMMVYYGWVVEEAETNQVYRVLREALKRMPKEQPFRGPESFREGNYHYRNALKGTVENFSGKEQISKNAEVVYQASYIGGLVDQRGGV